MSTEVTEQEKIDDMNEVIAQFDGWKKEIRKGIDCFIKNGRLRYHYELKYHEDWNQLRKVIDKIFTYALAYPEQVRKVIDLKIVVNIDAAHKAVYDFIQWYQSSLNTSK